MSKLKVRNATNEEIEEIDPGEELMIDLTRGCQALDDDLQERIKFLQSSLADTLGWVSQFRVRPEEWDEERMESLFNALKFAWHFRQEMRLLFSEANPDHDVSDISKDWPFVTDHVFGERHRAAREDDLIH